ncbi:MAG: AbfB domain-containing protein [Actinomycetes bacterium]
MTKFNFESVNLHDHFIRHAGFLAELTPRWGRMNDFAFTLTRRGEGLVAFRSANFPDMFLRHSHGRIRLDRPTGLTDKSWLLDSTFYVERGLSDDKGFSFRSLNAPDRYLRHRDFHLILDAPSRGDNLFRRDATFLRWPAAVIDYPAALSA